MIARDRRPDKGIVMLIISFTLVAAVLVWLVVFLYGIFTNGN